jgi:hypothetical protein
MQPETTPVLRASWPAWADFLHQRGLDGLAVWALESAHPLTLLAAQVLYLGRPLLRPAVSNGQIEALASLLEDHNEMQAFVTFLREETP